MRSLARTAARSAVPSRSVFFGKMTNSSLELVFRSIFRLEHVKRVLAYGHAGTYGTPWRHSSLPTHDGAAELAQQHKESGEKLGLAPLPMYSDPHRVLRLYACLANPVLDHEGKQEIHHGGQSFGIGHGDHGHGHGEHKGFFARWSEKRALAKQHAREDGSLARGLAYESEQPTWYDMDRPVWWCEHYKVTVPYMQAELCIFLARTLLRTLGYEPTPEAADKLIDELYEDVDTQLLEQWREGQVNGFPTKTFFLEPATTYQTTEDMQHFITPSFIWGGPYGSQAKWQGFGNKKDWKWEVERFKPENVLVRDPREGQLKGNFANPAH